jgi:hypothetical protein
MDGAKKALDNANGVTDPLKLTYDAAVTKKTTEAATTTDAKKLYDDKKVLHDATPTKEKDAEALKVTSAKNDITANFNTWKGVAVTATTKYTAYLT